jgi:hypothetical protein
MRTRRPSDDEKFHNLFDAVPVPTYTWRRRDDDFVLESYNGAADAASRRRAASFVGRTAKDVYADEPTSSPTSTAPRAGPSHSRASSGTRSRNPTSGTRWR